MDTDSPPVEEAEWGRGDGLAIDGGGVTVVSKQLLELWVKEMHPEFPKTLDVVGLNWLKCLYNVS